jgi:hypothetical protein
MTSLNMHTSNVPSAGAAVSIVPRRTTSAPSRALARATELGEYSMPATSPRAARLRRAGRRDPCPGRAGAFRVSQIRSTRVPLDAVEVSSRCRLFQSRELGLASVFAWSRHSCRRNSPGRRWPRARVRGLGITHHQPAAVASHDRHSRVGELVGEMLVATERQCVRGRHR